jgi:hypothetical protein
MLASESFADTSPSDQSPLSRPWPAPSDIINPELRTLIAAVPFLLQISNGRSGSGDRWKAQHLSRLLGGRLQRHAHANTLNNVPSHAGRH